MRLFITGGSGLLGSRIANIAVSRKCEVYSGYNEHAVIMGTPIRLDVCNREQVSQAFKKARPEAVVHAAAMSNVDKCEDEKELAWRVNVEGTKNIVECSEAHEAFLLYVSTDYVFSGKKGMYKEADEPDPINYYGQTKREAERIVADSTAEWCIARPSVIYGSTPAAGKENFALWVIKKIEDREPIKVIRDQWVSPTLNTNLAEMILEVVDRNLVGIHHLASYTTE